MIGFPYKTVFYKKKTICIKFGSKVLKEGESTILDVSDLLWTENSIHPGNYIPYNYDIDCNASNLSLLVMLISSWQTMGD